MNLEQLEWDFQYHKPDENAVERHAALRNACHDLAVLINDACQDSREKSLAITKVEEAMLWANAAIARENRPESAK